MFLGLDLGTSSLKGLIVDGGGRAVAQASVPLDVDRPHPGWSEQDPASWIRAARHVFAALRQSAPGPLAAVKGIGLSGHMHGATLLDDRDQVLRPCPLWNDRRAQAEALNLDEQPLVRARSGNRVFAGFTAPKVAWLRRHEPQVFEKIRMVLSPKDYLGLWLTGQRLSEPSDASGTAWFDPSTRRWDADLLDLTGLSPNQMPDLVEGSQPRGQVRAPLAADLGLNPQAPVLVAGGGGDNAATAVGLGLTHAGTQAGFLSLGTSGVLMMPADRHMPAPQQGVHAFCHAVPDRWLQMGVMLACTDALNWYARSQGKTAAALTADLPDEIAPPTAALFFPFLVGERTPHASTSLRGGWSGLSLDQSQQDMTQGVLQGIGFALKDILDCLPQKPQRLWVAGGGSASAYWLQLLAIILNTPLDLREGASHAAALGAARLGRACVTGELQMDHIGVLDGDQNEVQRSFDPDPALVPAYAEAQGRFSEMARRMARD